MVTLSRQLSSLFLRQRSVFILLIWDGVGEPADCLTPGTSERPDLGRFNIEPATLKVSFEPLSNFSRDQFKGGGVSKKGNAAEAAGSARA